MRVSGVPAGSYRANDFPAFGLTRTAGRDASEAADCSEHRKPVQAPADLMVRGRPTGRAGHEDPRELSPITGNSPELITDIAQRSAGCHGSATGDAACNMRRITAVEDRAAARHLRVEAMGRRHEYAA